MNKDEISNHEKREVFSAIFICHNDIVNRSWTINQSIKYVGLYLDGEVVYTGRSSPEQKYF